MKLPKNDQKTKIYIEKKRCRKRQKNDEKTIEKRQFHLKTS